MKQQARSSGFLTTFTILFCLERDAFRSNVKLNPQIMKNEYLIFKTMKIISGLILFHLPSLIPNVNMVHTEAHIPWYLSEYSYTCDQAQHSPTFSGVRRSSSLSLWPVMANTTEEKSLCFCFFFFFFLREASPDELSEKFWIDNGLGFSSKTQCWQYRAGTNGSENESTQFSATSRDGSSLWSAPFVTKLLRNLP